MKRFAILLSVLALVGLGAFAAPAVADTFGNGPPNEGYKADSSYHTYCYGPGFDSGLETHADYAMGTSIDADTDMSDGKLSSCDSSTDVEWLDANLPSGTRGSYSCPSRSGDICLSSDVKLDPAELNIGSNDYWDTRKTACHEAGHSTGLRHGGSIDCMLSGEVPSTALQYRRFSDHHKTHINDAY